MIRLFVRFFAGILLALLAAAAIVYVLLRYPPGRAVGEELESQMTETAVAMAKSLAAAESSELDWLLDRGLEGSAFIGTTQPIDDMELPTAEENALLRGEHLFMHDAGDGPMLWVPIADTRSVVGIWPREPLYDPYPLEILTAAAGALAVIVVFGFLLAVPVVRRLKALEEAARAFGQGDWEVRADDRYPDTIGDLGHALNRMSSRIQQLLQDQQELLQAVAHELRAPLSRLGFAVQIAEDASDDEQRAEAYDDMQEALTQLNSLVSEVLGYARLQPGASPLEMEIASLDPIVEQIVQQQRVLHADVEFVTHAHAGHVVRAAVDAGYFYRSVVNLVSNAARYARRRVEISWGTAVDSFWLTVDDDGIGIPPYQRERVFEPFTRLDPSRSRDSGGTGLGLAIVKRIAQKHNGSVSVADSPLGGTRFRLQWPLEPAPGQLQRDPQDAVLADAETPPERPGVDRA